MTVASESLDAPNSVVSSSWRSEQFHMLYDHVTANASTRDVAIPSILLAFEGLDVVLSVEAYTLKNTIGVLRYRHCHYRLGCL